ncbi:MAG TPA: hypothetical protein VGG89_08440 [Candidatus Baltobacteraceae bacterium]|jgi:hypothetical protein
MGFLKKLLGGGSDKATQLEPPPTDAEFEEAEQRLSEAMEKSPHRASPEITTMSTALYELYSKRGDYLKATGDTQGFLLNTADGLSMYTMAAQSNYHTGWFRKAITALETGLAYANEARKVASSSPHIPAINEEQQGIEDLLKTYSLELEEGQQAVLSICTALRDAGTRVTSDGDPIWKVRGLKAYVLALSDAVASVVYAVVAPGTFGPYADIWKQDKIVFWELASFLGYYFATRSLTEDSVINNEGDTILSVIASIWPPNERMQAILGRYEELIKNPQEMKDRRILWHTHPKANDDNARNVVYEYIVNELINGPDLGGSFEGNLDSPECILPSEGMFMKIYMQNMAMQHIKELKAIAAGL